MKKRRMLCAVLFLFLGIVAMGGRTYGKETEKRFKIELDYGIDGKAVYGKAAPVTVTLHNYGADFEGRVKLYSARSGDDKQIAYCEEAMIPELGSKELEFILPELESYSSMWIIVEDAGGRILMQEERTVSVDNLNSGIIGVLSGDANALSYLSGADLYDQDGGQMEVLYLKSQHISEVRGALEGFRVLLISSFETSGLSGSQYEVIRDWVEAGGILVLGTGAEYKKTLSAFEKDGYLTGQTGEVSQVLRDFQVTNSLGEPVTAEIPVLDFSVEGGKLNGEFSSQAVEKGRGAVYLFDFAFESLSGWKHNKEAASNIFWYIMNDFIPELSVREMLSDDYTWNARSMISDSGIGQMPGILPYILLLLTYIILLPVLYFILKKADKRHYIWFTVPAMAALFGVVLYRMGTGTRRKEPFINYSAVLQMDGGGALESDFFAVTSPRNKEFHIGIDKGYRVQVIPDYGYYSYDYQFQPKDIDVELVNKEDRTEIGLRTVQAFSKTYFHTERYTEDAGSLSLDVSFSIDGLSGTVTNDTEYDLSDCAVVTRQFILPIGTLKKGESVDLKTLQLDVQSGYSLVSEILFPYQYGDLEEEQKAMVKRNLLSTLFDYGNYISSSQVHFIGFPDSYAPGFIGMTGLEAEGVSMVMAEAELKYEEGNHEFISDIWQYGEKLEGDFLHNQRVYLTTQSGVVEYNMNGFEQVDAVYKLSESYYDDVSVEFYNYGTEEFDTVLEFEDKMENLEDYLGGEKKLKIRYTNNSSYYQSYEEAEIPILGVFVTRQAAE